MGADSVCYDALGSMRIDSRYQRSSTAILRVAARLGIFCGLLLVAGPGAEAQSGFQIVVHSSSSITSMPQEAVSRLFLKKDTTWSTGGEVLPVDQAGDSAVRKTFSEAIHGRGTSQIQRYWQQQLFSGAAVPPSELASDAAVIDFVKSNPGAVGYVRQGSSVRGVKVLRLAEATAEATVADYPTLTTAMTPPRLLDTVDPEYPLVARRARYECALTIKAEIDSSGKVQGVYVVTPCDRFQKQLNESAVKAIRRWTFEPALDSGGKATPVSYTFQVWFTL